MFVRFFNFDPRSATLNTEMELMIESTSMAERVARWRDLLQTSGLDGHRLVSRRMAFVNRLSYSAHAIKQVEASRSIRQAEVGSTPR